MNITEQLFELKDEKYAAFQSSLTPGVERELFIGVRVPEVRKLAKAICKEGDCDEFLSQLPHLYYDENMLHGLIISEIKDYDRCTRLVNEFLPYVDNWAVCDIMSPKIFKKHKAELLTEITQWIESPHTYTCRFGIEMLMSHFLDDDYDKNYLELPAKVVSEEYYVNMMLAWFYATALAKQWEDTIVYLETGRLGTWVHNKTIQKAIESYRITDVQKEYLRTLKVRKN